MEVGEGVAHHSQDSENKERARLAQTKLTPCEIQRWLGACLGTVYMVWTPNLEKNWRAEQFPIHEDNKEAEYLFNESAVGKGIYL